MYFYVKFDIQELEVVNIKQFTYHFIFRIAIINEIAKISTVNDQYQVVNV